MQAPRFVSEKTRRRPASRHRPRGRIWTPALLAAVGLVAGCSSSTSSLDHAAHAASRSASAKEASADVDAATVSSLGRVLVDSKGMTLYRNTEESEGHVVCTGACTEVWPPFTVAPGTTPRAGQGVSGTLSTITRPDGGTQVTYDGSPLYLYRGDHAAGQANGNGVEGIWFAVSAQSQNATSTSTTNPSSGSSTSTTVSGASPSNSTGTSAGSSTSPTNQKQTPATAPPPTSAPPTSPPTTPPTSPPTVPPTTPPTSPPTTYYYG